MNNINEILYSGLEEVLKLGEFQERKNAVNGEIFEKIISDTRRGRIQWKRDLDDQVYARTTATVKNYRGQEVSVPVVFFSTASAEGYIDYYLRIGERNGPQYCGEEVRELVRDF